MNGQKPLLVVIDDEQGILDVVGRFAQRAGYEAITCSSGREAIAQLQTRRADLVMVDLRMPDVGGLDVLRAIREIDPRCQAVLMTGYASVPGLALELGATDYLSKPLDFARLEDCWACATSSAAATSCRSRGRGAAPGILRDDRPPAAHAGSCS
jgi:DNA-binding NtrC family response regulator